MNPSDIIAEVAKLGVALRVERDNIVYRGPRGALKPEHIAKLTAHKPAIIAELLDTRILFLQCPADVAERSAIIAEGDHCDNSSADRRALSDGGYASLQAFGDAHRRQITAALSALPSPTDLSGDRLLAETRRFLGSNWFLKAVKCGWTLEELFGVDSHLPSERFEHWGLVVGLALAPQSGGALEYIDAERAAIRCRAGSPCRIERRFKPARSVVMWWECRQITAM